MSYLLMCEGPNEETIINILLDNEKLKINRDELIGLRPYNLRQLNNPYIVSELKRYNKPVIIYRIGDTQKDKIAIPREIRHIVSQDRIYKFCTKPELEMILIINENLLDEYRKVQSKVRPKAFAKENIRLNGKRYNNSSEFYQEYYSGSNVESLVENLKSYKRNKNHNSGEGYLADLLNENAWRVKAL